MVDFRAKHGRVAASILLRHWFRVNLWTLDMSEKRPSQDVIVDHDVHLFSEKNMQC